MTKEAKAKKSIFAYLILTFVLSSICYILWIRGGKAADGMSWILMWCPAVAALTVREKYYRGEKLLGWNPCGFSSILAAVVVPVIYLGVSYGIYWLFGKTSLLGNLNPVTAAVSSHTHRSGSAVLIILVLIVLSVITAAGEEIGWRGFLLPQMAAIWGKKAAVVMTGLIWAVWHMPIMIAGLYLPGTPLWYKLPMFAIQAVSLTAIMAILRFRSKSVWPAVLLHASHNFFDQAICQPLTSSSSSTYYVGETGIITIAAIILTAIGTNMFFKYLDRKKWNRGETECAFNNGIAEGKDHFFNG